MSAAKRQSIGRTSCNPKQKSCSYKQAQTGECFSYKWSRRDTYESEVVKDKHKKWLIERYCDSEPRKITQWLGGGERKIILDAGCGSGFSALLLFGEHLKHHGYVGVDISNAVEVAKQRFVERGIRGNFVRGNILDLPIAEESIDIIFSEGALHHTESTEEAIRALTNKLKKGGVFLFYVYKRKAVIREFTDDFVRECLTVMSNEQAWEALKPLTKLGQALGKLNVAIEIPEDIPFLGMTKGTIDLQRFFYWNICKVYYDPQLNLDELNHINFDWFRPLNCHRHTPEEIKHYCQQNGLIIERMDVQSSGITVVARKK